MITNSQLVLSPLVFCLLLVLVQNLVDNELDKPSKRCGCTCVDTDGNGQCETKCGIEYSTLDQGFSCPIPHPPEWPPLLQIPEEKFRAVRTDFNSYQDLPNDSYKRTGSCPATMLITGKNKTFAQSKSSLHLIYSMIYKKVSSLLCLSRACGKSEKSSRDLIGVAGNMFSTTPLNINFSDILYSLADAALVCSLCFCVCQISTLSFSYFF